MRDTIDMAREAGFWQEHTNTYMCSADALKAFEALVRADEREACAKVCETAEVPIDISIWQETKKSLSAATAMGLANAIRARSKT